MVWLKRVFVIGLVAMALLLSFPATAFCTESSTSLSVMSYNIRGFLIGSWIWRSGDVSSVIEKEDADIVCLQECWTPLAVTATLEYEVVGSRFYEAGGTPIFYDQDKVKLLDDGFLELPGEHQLLESIAVPAVPRRCTWAKFENLVDGDVSFVFNLHLNAHSEEDRLDSLDMLALEIPKIVGDNHVVVVGDFNIEAGDRSVVEFKEALSFVDAYRAENPSEEGNTFQGFDKVRPKRIDYVLVCECSQILSARVIEHKNPPSDHNPLKVRVKW